MTERIGGIPGEDTFVAGEDNIDSPSTAGASATVHFAPTVGGARGRVPSDGSDDVFFSDPVEIINMEGGEDDEVRRKHANQKWNERRRQIEAEFQRLRHLSINHRRAGRIRHSMSFGDDLEIQLTRGDQRSTHGDSKRRIQSSFVPPVYERSASVPLRMNAPDYHGITQPTLETYDEIEEEEGSVEEDMMGLPPKDIPHRLSRSVEPLISELDMREIPLERIDVHEDCSDDGDNDSREGLLEEDARETSSDFDEVDGD